MIWEVEHLIYYCYIAFKVLQLILVSCLKPWKFYCLNSILIAYGHRLRSSNQTTGRFVAKIVFTCFESNLKMNEQNKNWNASWHYIYMLFFFSAGKAYQETLSSFWWCVGRCLTGKKVWRTFQSYLASSIFIACLIGSWLKRCRENVPGDFCDITFPTCLIPSCYNAPMVMKGLHVDTPSIYLS